MSVTYEQLRTAALELIGFAEHSDFCDWHEKKPCSCGYDAAYQVIREAGTSTFTPDVKAAPAAPAPAIAGALFDFLGFLTTSERRWTFSSTDDAGPAVAALEQWASKRSLSLDDADVEGWSAAPAAPAQAEAKPAPVGDRECNPHPKAPHGFSRNASHSMGRYVCDCECWEPYDAGYQEGLLAGLAHASKGEQA
jgi:hypothetical protein